MTIHCLGSINVDHVHRVPYFPAPGETLGDLSYAVGLGGKGANHALAAAAVGAEVRFIGAVGSDGLWARETLTAAGIDASGVAQVDAATGHAVIYVDAAGENQIVIHGGANRALEIGRIEVALEAASPGDIWLAQNETNLVARSMALAKARGLKTAYAAAPFDAGAVEAVLPHLDILAMNEGEAAALKAHLGAEPKVPLILTTLGKAGVILRRANSPVPLTVSAFDVDVVDTTGAGDTFFGVFVGAMDQGADMADAARTASAAAAICVTRAGAADAIPSRADIDAFLETRA